MSIPHTRAGGDRLTNSGNLNVSAAANTAGAPAIPSSIPALPPRAIAAEAGGATDGDAPRWIELIPAGVFHGRDGRGPFRLDDPKAVIAATSGLGMKAGIPIDYDHATDFAAPEGRPAPAAGWIRDFEVRDGAVWGRVEWTVRAAAAIAAREYRYVSPVFQFDPADGHVTRILRAGLTNNPNLYLTAIAAAETLGARSEEGMMEEFLEKLREMLGLQPGVGEQQVLDAIRTTMSDAGRAEAAHAGAHDPARFVAVAEYQRALTELNAMRAERARERAAIVVDEAMRAGKLIPAQREWAIAYCAADPKGFQAFAAKQPSILGAEQGFDAAQPASVASARGGLTQSETAICAQLGIAPADFIKRRTGSADFLSLNRGPAGENR